MSKLGIRSGKLVRSFGRNSTDSLYNVTYSNGKFSITLGSKLPYAEYQNRKFIKASPVTVIRSYDSSKANKMGAKRKPFRTYQMSRFFWAKWYETQDDKYKYMAFKSHKLGGLEGTQYFDKSIDYLNNNILPKEYANIIKYISDMSRKSEIGKLNALFVDRVRAIANRMPDLFQLALSEFMEFKKND